MTENADDSEQFVEFDWSEADSMNVEPVNVFVVQAGPGSYVLNLGFVNPPVRVGPRVPPLERLSVHVVSRVLLTPESAGALLQGLVENTQRRDDQQEAGDES